MQQDICSIGCSVYMPKCFWLLKTGDYKFLFDHQECNPNKTDKEKRVSRTQSKNLPLLFSFYIINVRFFSLDYSRCRSSHGRYSIKKDVLKMFSKFTGKHLSQSLLFNKVASLKPFAKHLRLFLSLNKAICINKWSEQLF